MDFKLSKTHLLQQEMYRKFAENEVIKRRQTYKKDIGSLIN